MMLLVVSQLSLMLLAVKTRNVIGVFKNQVSDGHQVAHYLG